MVAFGVPEKFTVALLPEQIVTPAAIAATGNGKTFTVTVEPLGGHNADVTV